MRMTMEALRLQNQTVRYPFSSSSLSKLVGVHPKLVEFAFELANVMDCKIVYGVRTDSEQMELFKKEKTTFDGVNKRSKHQVHTDGLGYALDILPLPKGVNMYDKKDPENKLRWAQFDGVCQTIAYFMGIQVRTGFKWRSNIMDSLARPEKDNTLPDGNHVELVV